MQKTTKIQIRNYLAFFLVLACVVIFNTGCFSTGKDFDESKVSEIVEGQTTESALVALFGQPQSRGMNSSGQTTLLWTYLEAHSTGPFSSTSTQKTLSVILGSDGTVQSYNVQTTGM